MKQDAEAARAMRITAWFIYNSGCGAFFTVESKLWDINFHTIFHTIFRTANQATNQAMLFSLF